jgi:hypothetical protein
MTVTRSRLQFQQGSLFRLYSRTLLPFLLWLSVGAALAITQPASIVAPSPWQDLSFSGPFWGPLTESDSETDDSGLLRDAAQSPDDLFYLHGLASFLPWGKTFLHHSEHGQRPPFPPVRSRAARSPPTRTTA